jgi:hypothetical protein
MDKSPTHSFSVLSDHATVMYDDGSVKYQIRINADGSVTGKGTFKQPELVHALPTDPESIEAIKNTERRRRSCCDRPEGT